MWTPYEGVRGRGDGLREMDSEARIREIVREELRANIPADFDPDDDMTAVIEWMVWEDDAACWVYVSPTAGRAQVRSLHEDGCGGSDGEVAEDGVPVAGVRCRDSHDGGGSVAGSGVCSLDDPGCLFLRYLEVVARVIHRVRWWACRLMIRHWSSP
jgi:hypothetical protein